MAQLSFADDFPHQESIANGLTDYFSRLSDELILKIFSNLPKSALCNVGTTCQRLRHLSLDESLWKRADLGGKAISGELLHKFLGRGVQYLRLSRTTICGRYYPNPPPLQIACRLRFLDLSMAEGVDEIIVYEILSRCTELVAVSLEGCWVNEMSCNSIGNNPALRVLNLALANGLTRNGIQRILIGCRNLEQLNLAWTKLDRNMAQMICSILPATMLRLNISGCRDEILRDEDIVALAGACPNLMELDVSDCADLTQKSIETIATSLLNLRILSCSRCYRIDPIAYTSLPPSLDELNIFNSIHDASWPAFVSLMPEGLRLNTSPYSTIARPTVGIRRTSIWGQRTRDE